MSYLVFSCSLNPDSNSRILVRAAYEELDRLEVPVEFVDLRELSLPMCDGGACYEHPQAVEMAGKILAAKGVLLGVPVYNYAVSASAKNLLELTGSAWYGTTVGFLSAAGGRRSYMSVMAFANSLMLDYRCLIVPRFIYADDSQFRGGHLRDPALQPRIVEVCRTLVTLAPAYDRVAPRPPSPATG
jgi:FMN reductase